MKIIGNDNMNCKKCNGKCNKKGYPSVRKGSAYCESQRGITQVIFGKEKTRMQTIKDWLAGII